MGEIRNLPVLWLFLMCYFISFVVHFLLLFYLPHYYFFFLLFHSVSCLYLHVFLNRQHPFFLNDCVYKFNFTYHCIIIIIFSFVLFTKTTLLNSTSKYKLCLFYYSTCWRWCVTHRNVQIKKNDLYHHLHHFPNMLSLV